MRSNSDLASALRPGAARETNTKEARGNRSAAVAALAERGCRERRPSGPYAVVEVADRIGCEACRSTLC